MPAVVVALKGETADIRYEEDGGIDNVPLSELKRR
jgi:hypothetical protein